MIVQVAPTPLHESIAPILVDSIKAATNDLPASIRTGLRTRTSKEYVGFTDNPLGSGKIPDLAITYKVPNGNTEIVLVLEVGFTQNWDDLVKIARRWIEKTAEVNMVLIAKLTENPKYLNPLRNTTNEQLELLELKSASDIRDGDFELEGESGPVTLKGFSWVGTLSECYIEAWVRDKRGAAAKLGERVVSQNTLLPSLIIFPAIQVSVYAYFGDRTYWI